MNYTYNTEDNSPLIIRATDEDRKHLNRIRQRNPGKPENVIERRALAEIVGHWKPLKWIEPDRVGIPTDAPLVGMTNPRGQVVALWSWVGYATRNLVDELILKGEATLPAAQDNTMATRTSLTKLQEAFIRPCDPFGGCKGRIQCQRCGNCLLHCKCSPDDMRRPQSARRSVEPETEGV